MNSIRCQKRVRICFGVIVSNKDKIIAVKPRSLCNTINRDIGHWFHKCKHSLNSEELVSLPHLKITWVGSWLNWSRFRRTRLQESAEVGKLHTWYEIWSILLSMDISDQLMTETQIHSSESLKFSKLSLSSKLSTLRLTFSLVFHNSMWLWHLFTNSAWLVKWKSYLVLKVWVNNGSS